MDGLTNMIEAARRQFGQSARVFVDGFELDDDGKPIGQQSWGRPADTWLQRRIAALKVPTVSIVPTPSAPFQARSARGPETAGTTGTGAAVERLEPLR